MIFNMKSSWSQYLCYLPARAGKTRYVTCYVAKSAIVSIYENISEKKNRQPKPAVVLKVLERSGCEGKLR